MKLKRIAGHAVLAAGVALGVSVHAQTSPQYARPGSSVPYATGGVGTDEQEHLRTLEQEGYNLHLLFAERGTGAYLADVGVTVRDASGRTVLDTLADGPALVAKLPPGHYEVTAEHDGIRQTRTVTVGRGGQVAFYWPAEPGSAPEPADMRAPHGDAPPLAPAHAGRGVGSGR